MCSFNSYFLFCNIKLLIRYSSIYSVCFLELLISFFYTLHYWLYNLHAFLAYRSGASLLSSSDCVSPKQRRWPEDITWHPEGHSLFSAYSADGGDSQISVLNLNKTQGVSKALTNVYRNPHELHNKEFSFWKPLFVLDIIKALILVLLIIDSMPVLLS